MAYSQHPKYLYFCFFCLFVLTLHFASSMAKYISHPPEEKAADAKAFDNAFTEMIVWIGAAAFLLWWGNDYSTLAPNLLTTEWPQYHGTFVEWEKHTMRGQGLCNVTLYDMDEGEEDKLFIVNPSRCRDLTGGEEIIYMSLTAKHLPNTYILRYRKAADEGWIEIANTWDLKSSAKTMTNWVVIGTLLHAGAMAGTMLFMKYRRKQPISPGMIATAGSLLVLIFTTTGICIYSVEAILTQGIYQEALSSCLLILYAEWLLSNVFVFWLILQGNLPGITVREIIKQLF